MNCKDCNYHRTDGTCANKQSDYFGLAIEDGCIWHEADWIRVENRLPEQDVHVLTYARHDWYDWRTKTIHSIDCYDIAFLHGEEWLTDRFDPQSTITVTHWMPLIPPEE